MPYFNIQQLTKQNAPSCTRTATLTNIRDEVIEIYLVFQGCVTIINKESFVFLESNNLYWVHHDKHRRIKTDPSTEGYIISFNKTLLQTNTYLPISCPFPQTDEIIRTDGLLWNQALCEMMHQEFEGASDLKMQVLGGLLSVFLLHLTRRSNVVMYIPAIPASTHSPSRAGELSALG
ncbi:MAG: hypothetical protein JST68_30445 [Bacteroidetes bacterium]|nr:hypothetical protein [Bacteroidota bacterium]